ncbi:MAG: polyketide synthase [Streptosporangiaceae bacterium]
MNGRRDQGGPIAVIGIACRFPGARDPAEFHDLTVAGLRLFRPVSGSAPGRARHAALLDDWKATRAASGAAEPGTRDPVPIQRLAAETTALALADAGLRSAAGILGDAVRARRGPGRTVGHAAGALGQAAGAAGQDSGVPDQAAGTAGQTSGAAGRAGLVIASAAPDVCGLVSEQFGFSTDVRYPETAYLSSLHAVIAAADALQAGELDLAVAGGAELGVDPAWLDQQARAGTLGSDEMRVYAADPAGLLPGEGCGIVILARAADAHAAGLPVYAEIAGWSTAPVLRPTPTGAALLPAYHRAGIDPADIHLVEGHGTGTAAGDLTELTALAQLRREGKTTAALGAVSANIGYSRAATGIASLIKAALAMATGTIPPGTGCARPHPLIEAGDTRLRLPERPEAWPEGTRLAAVNSLGTANPATMDGASAWPGAEGVHLVLRREGEGDRRPGRRRRTTTGIPEAAADRIGADTGSWPPAPGKHAAPGPQGTGAAILEAPRTTAVPAAAIPGAAAAGEAFACADGDLAGRGVGLALALSADVLAPPGVFVLCGGDAGALADKLDVIAASAPVLSYSELRELARQLAVDAVRGCDEGGGAVLRVALAPATPQ